MVRELTRVWVVAVPIRSFEKSIRFYRDILGLEVQLDARKFNWVEVGPDEPLCKVGFTEIRQSDDWRKPGGVTGIVFETYDIEGFYRRVAVAGVKFTLAPMKQPWGGIVANFLDPDGNELQVVQHAASEHYGADIPPEGEESLRSTPVG